MWDCPAKLEISAEEFDTMDGEALSEWIGPWLIECLSYDADHGPPFPRTATEPSLIPYSIKVSGAAYWLWADVGNGGLRQYFYNSAYGLPFAKEALSALNLEPAAETFGYVLQILPAQSLRWDFEARREFVKSPSNAAKLEQWDDRFWEELDDGSFIATWQKFVRTHRGDFEPHFVKSGSKD